MATGGDTVNITNAYEDSRLANLECRILFLLAGTKNKIKLVVSQDFYPFLNFSQLHQMQGKKAVGQTVNLRHFSQFWMEMEILGRAGKEKKTQFDKNERITNRSNLTVCVDFVRFF